MIDHGLLPSLLLTYAIALVLLIALARLRVPSIVALMLAGVVAGPHGVGVISRPEDVEMLAELGIVLLLFTVGLDFSMTAVREIWRTIVIAGVLQIVGTAALIAVLEVFVAGVSPQLAIFIGLFVALSSTAIVQSMIARARAAQKIAERYSQAQLDELGGQPPLVDHHHRIVFPFHRLEHSGMLACRERRRERASMKTRVRRAALAQRVAPCGGERGASLARRRRTLKPNARICRSSTTSRML